MERVFYEVTPGSPAFEFCETHAAERKSVKQAFADYAKAKGARGWTEGFTGLSGLIFDYGASIPEGFKEERRRTLDGRVNYTPRYSTKAGKMIAKEIEALPPLPRQSEFAQHFGIPTGLRYTGGDCIHGSMSLTCGGVFENSLIAWTEPGAYWVVLPDIDAEIAKLLEQHDTVEPSTWALPEGLKRSSKARYELALARAKVREEEEARNA